MSIETETLTKPDLSTGSGSGKALLRHFVELDTEGKPTDQCLCGHIWDRVFLNNDPDADVCQACLDELRRRGHG